VSRFERWNLWITSAVTAVSGFGFLWTKYLLSSSDPWAVVNHPLEPWFLRVHVVAAPLFVFAVGLITTRHIWCHLRGRVPSGRWSGIAVLALLAPMVLSGYLVQVVTGTWWLRALAWLHIGLGTLFVAGLMIHRLAVREALRSANGRVKVRAERPPRGDWRQRPDETFVPLVRTTEMRTSRGGRPHSEEPR
jgi:hypothetical protein